MTTATQTKKTGKKARSRQTYRKRQILQVYDYLDESRQLVYQAVRLEIIEPADSKSCFRRPNPNNPPDPTHPLDPNDPDDRNHWIWNLEGITRILYNLPEILNQVNIALNTVHGKPLFICEGEKDIESLRKIGLLATTNPGGALAWQDDYAKFLNDYRSVVVLPDNDERGRTWSQTVRKSLQKERIPEIRIIELPGLAEHGDVSDYLDGDGSKQKLLTLVKDRLPIKSDIETDLLGDRFFATDVFNANRFVKKYSNKVKYCPKVGWLFYDGKRWNRDTGQLTAEKFARKTATDLYTLIRKTDKQGEQNEIFKWFIRSQTERKIKAILGLGRSYDEIVTSLEDLDTEPYLFNCDNGTINLRTQQFREHRPGDMITQLAPVTYDLKASYLLWLTCLNTWMRGDTDKIEYLQRLMGMCLTGDTSARRFPVFHGSGRNGKSIFLDTVSGLMGDYAYAAPEDLLAEKDYRSHPTEIASLLGKRLVTLDETAPNMKLRLPLVKRMTGDQMMTARFMRQDAFSFKITSKMILSTQHLPRITEITHAIWDRVHLVPWSYRITEEEEIPKMELLSQLRSQWPGILNWLLEGCRKWQEEGSLLRPPDSIKTATEEYRKASDILAEFVEETVRFNMPEESRIKKIKLYKLYRQYAKNHEIEHPISDRKFTEYFRTKGVRDKQQWTEGKNVKVWYGIGLQGELPM